METKYRGPSTVTTIHVGSTAIRLVRPAEPDRLLDDGEVHDLNRRDDYMPYWAYLWPGAFLLAELVARGRWAGEPALEIGCGLGLAGLVGTGARAEGPLHRLRRRAPRIRRPERLRERLRPVARLGRPASTGATPRTGPFP